MISLANGSQLKFASSASAWLAAPNLGDRLPFRMELHSGQVGFSPAFATRTTIPSAVGWRRQRTHHPPAHNLAHQCFNKPADSPIERRRTDFRTTSRPSPQA